MTTYGIAAAIMLASLLATVLCITQTVGKIKKANYWWDIAGKNNAYYNVAITDQISYVGGALLWAIISLAFLTVFIGALLLMLLL